MKTLTKIALLASAFSISSVQAIPVTFNYTVDNTVLDFGICANPGCSPLTNPTHFSQIFPKGPNQNNWTNADSYTVDLAPGTYEISFVGSNTGTGSSGNPAGLLAEIIWGGNTNVSSNAWDVTTDGVTYVAATEWAQNGTGIWGSNLIGEISSNAKWIWTANNFNNRTESVAGFRTSITIAPVSEPAALALLGLSLFGLGFVRRIKA